MEPIFVPNGEMRMYLGRTFKRSAPFVRKALAGKTNHPDALRIRAFARQKLEELREGKFAVLG
jgi:hypothetical protein